MYVCTNIVTGIERKNFIIFKSCGSDACDCDSLSLSYVCKVSPKKNGGIGAQGRKKSKVLDLHPCIVISRSGGNKW